MTTGMEGDTVRRLEGKRCIVTGAAAGIGRAIAERFLHEGARVLISVLAEASTGRSATDLAYGCASMAVDVADPERAAAMVARAVDDWGGLDVLVNNAGVGIAATVVDTDLDDWERVQRVNLTGTFLGMKYAIPAMRRRGGGSIINLASIASVVGVPERAAYSAAKGGIMALSRAAAIDHVAEGIRINCIAPGTVDTPWVQRITDGLDDPAAARAAMRARQPHGRLVRPDEVAAMAAYLAADESASTIGAVLMVDGGMTAR